MENYYLKTITVPIPEDKLVVIRKGERVEYEIDRIYLPEEQNTRVKRKVIGKVDPVQPGRMFPNEFYFELFPDNEVPEEIREEFLRECEIKRQMRVIRRSPEEVVDHVVRGLYQMSQEEKDFASADATRAFRSPPCPPSDGISPDDGINKYLRLIEEGLTYSDVLLMMKWYKVLPR